MFQEMRRKDREVSREESEQVLMEGEYGVLSSIGENGYPYGVPVNYVYYNGRIYFHCAREGNKLRNIKNNSKVSFLVVTNAVVVPDQFSTNYKSVIAFGRAREIEDQLKDEVLLRFIYKYTGDHIDAGQKYIESDKHKTKVIEIEIDHLTGKSRDI